VPNHFIHSIRFGITITIYYHHIIIIDTHCVCDVDIDINGLKSLGGGDKAISFIFLSVGIIIMILDSRRQRAVIIKILLY
jgi:hypothetical protein